jgi:hypothetical protein
MASAGDFEYEDFLKELADRKIKFIVFGSFARYIAKLAGSYGDMDLMYEGSPENIKKVADLIDAFEGQKQTTPDGDRPNFRIFINQKGQKVDLLGEFAFASEDGTTKVRYKDLMGKSSTVEFMGMKLQVFCERISQSMS